MKFKQYCESKEDLSPAIANEIVSALKNKPEGQRVTPRDIEKAETVKNTAVASIRYWGIWELPEDADPDEEDYDWEELSQSSHSKISAYIKEFQKKYPDYNISYVPQEKNWINIVVVKK